MNDQPYDNDEIRLFGYGAKPARGIFCQKCQNAIPRFAALSTEQEIALRKLVDNKQLIEAMRQLRMLTNCNLVWAKIWTLHDDRLMPVEDHCAVEPCPRCHRPLSARDTDAAQCRYCKPSCY